MMDSMESVLLKKKKDQQLHNNAEECQFLPYKKRKVCDANKRCGDAMMSAQQQSEETTTTKPADGGGKSDFDKLPKELVYRIMAYLTPDELCYYVAPVCKQWNVFANDPILWKRVYLHADKTSRASALEILGRCHQHVATLALCKYALTDELAARLGRCAKLNVLILTACQGVSADLVASLTANAPHVQEASFEASDLKDAAAVLVSGWKALHTVNLTLTHVTEESVVHIAKKCSKLKHLNVETTGLTENAMKVVVEERRTNLRKLYLEGSWLSDTSCEMLSRCKELDTLSILNAKRLTDKSLRSLTSFTKLKYLRITQGLSFSSRGLSSLFRESKSRLTFLDLSECFDVNDGVVHSITSSKSGSHLEILTLDHCCFLTDTGIDAIVKKCRNLKVLSVAGSKLIKGASLKNASLTMPNLTSLNLRLCDNVKENVICELLEKKVNLRIRDPRGRKALAGVPPEEWKTSDEVDGDEEFSLTMRCIEDWGVLISNLVPSSFVPLGRHLYNTRIKNNSNV